MKQRFALFTPNDREESLDLAEMLLWGFSSTFTILNK